MSEQIKMSLWGDELSIESSPSINKKLINKIQNPKEVSIEKVVKSKSIDLETKLQLIKEEVTRVLGHYTEYTLVIRDKQTFIEYIDKAILNGIIAIDTETNNTTDTFNCELMGLCLYTPGLKQAYIPVHHIDRKTNIPLPNQLTEADIKEQLNRLEDTKIIFHNAAFDIKVIYNTCGIKLKAYWDTYIGARLLDENEKASLKEQYRIHIDPSQEKYDIEHLFQKLSYAIIDPELFALYAATDSFMTYKLYLYQLEQFKLEDNLRLFNLFNTVEMPSLEVVIDMELVGICLDLSYCERLRIKYHHLLDNLNKELLQELNKLKPKIDKWRLTPEANETCIIKASSTNSADKVSKSKNQQLADPPLLTSPTQLAILFYDILKIPVLDKKNPRGTGKAILEQLDIPLAKMLLEFKAFEKLVTSFIDVLPSQISPKDNRLHAHFNQLGTDTGRFTSTEPNLQQIPAKNKEIRMMFKATDGYTLIGSDFSAQEPRLFAEYSQEPNMLRAFKEGRDVYATLGEGVYKCNYWDCMEHFEDGTPNAAGKKRRKVMKMLYLGITYGMGTATIAERIGVSTKEAQQILDDFYKGFPKAKKWIDETHELAKAKGYVEDFWGRRRRLPDIQLPRVEVRESKLNGNKAFNPILGCKGLVSGNIKAINFYKEQANNCTYKRDFEALKEKAAKEGIYIKDNSGFISQAERQCVNARVQGGAATMSKKAMINLANDEELKKYGFRMLICIHDEIIGECKEEYAQQCADRLTQIMSSCVPELTVNFKCDPTIEKSWNEEDYIVMIKDEYRELCKDKSEEEAFNLLCSNHIEETPEILQTMLN